MTVPRVVSGPAPVRVDLFESLTVYTAVRRGGNPREPPRSDPIENLQASQPTAQGRGLNWGLLVQRSQPTFEVRLGRPIRGHGPGYRPSKSHRRWPTRTD